MSRLLSAAEHGSAPCVAASDASARAAALATAARQLLALIEAGTTVSASDLRKAMTTAFDGSDAQGCWDWKTAYDAGELAQILFLRRYGQALISRSANAARILSRIERVAALLPAQTRRSQSSVALQQFSTPAGLAYVAAVAGSLQPGETMLEPSAGTGMLAIHGALAGTRLALNEFCPARAAILAHAFPGCEISRHDAAAIDDRLDHAIRPHVVLMNPPFSALANVAGRTKGAAMRHLRSALARLEPGGRLVAFTGASFSPDAPAWHGTFADLQSMARVVFTAAINGRIFARHGTTVETRLTVFDKLPAADPTVFPPSPGMAPDTATLLAWVEEHVPPRGPGAPPSAVSGTTGGCRPGSICQAPQVDAACNPAITDPAVELDYSCVEGTAPALRLGEALYEPFVMQALTIADARPHPTPLVQSASMASVAPPKPTYRPHLPRSLVRNGTLSEAQLESIVYAGEAHGGHLGGAWRVDDSLDTLTAAPPDSPAAVRFRRGWFLGDGTGAGKGRQVAGIILDNWMKGRKRALWISMSDRLLEDAQRDWSALGQERLLITPLSRFRQGAPITLGEGVLFTTYATLRSQMRGGRASRVQQIVDWLGADFDGVIVFDEAHAMANAAGGKGARGEVAASQQGRAGLRLQHALADARIVYVSATGATTVQNLAYAQRLGLWAAEDFPFATRCEFVAAIEEGGVAAMEVLARDLKSLGLYSARSLSFDGVEYDLLEHVLTPEQRRIYDAYAGAFQIIHSNLSAALQAAGVTSPVHGTLNAQARSSARSAFESAKQRFFNHLITAMQTPSAIASIERDIEAGHAAVVQIVSTGEALQERRLASVPTDEWDDVTIDITPREYVLDYLAHSFPVQLYEPCTADDGTLSSRPAFDAQGNPILNREACRRRDAMIERLAALPPVPGALDQIVQHFGADAVAEVTGRARRIVPRTGSDGVVRFVVEARPASANIAETQAFMDDAKRILVFSEAGGTGRSYHADLGAENQRRRIHYLLEAGWKADTAIQGFGRTNRTNQKQPPLFRPVSSDVKAQKRFISTIARRLDTLGALTRGQRQTGGQNMFRAEDNLESHYARDALRQLYQLIAGGKLDGCSLLDFEASTGLSLLDADGGLKDELPPITTFLNRLLALTLAMQDILFEAFEDLLSARIEGAIASGTYEVGLETLRAESFTITEARTIYTHPATGAETQLLTIARTDRVEPLSLCDALGLAEKSGGRMLVNSRSLRAAVLRPARSIIDEDGAIHTRVRLVRPLETTPLLRSAFDASHWESVDKATFERAWEAELAGLPLFEHSTLQMVSGLLLPIWKRLPKQSSRIYCLQTDAGDIVVGRKVPDAWVAGMLDADSIILSGEQAEAMLREGEAVLHLSQGHVLRRVRSMHDWRIELSGFDDLEIDRLKAMGLISEIISWKLRLFVPTGAVGAHVLGLLLGRYPVEKLAGRKAA